MTRVYEVITETGKKIVRTGNHPLFKAIRTKAVSGLRPKVASLGWCAVEDLKESDLVLVPKKIESEGSRSVDERHVKLLGYLLGDGGLTVGVTFTQKDGPIKDDFVSLVSDLDCKVTTNGEFVLSVSGNDYDVNNKFAANSNPIRNLCKEWGIFGKKSKDKSFPAWAWELPNSQLAVLINRLFSCDGWAYVNNHPTKGQCQIGICLASERMIRDVEIALLRLGISGRIRPRKMKLKDKVFTSWEWKTTNANEVELFYNTVGIFGKERQLEEVYKYALNISRKNMTKWREYEAPNGYKWEAIKSITSQGESRTVAISVQDHHTYVTTFVEHNTFTGAAIALSWIDLHPPGQAIVITSAHSGTQVKIALWREIARLHAKYNFPGRLNQQEWYLTVPSGNEELVAFGRKPRDEDSAAFQGTYNPYVLVLLDEACYVNPAIWQGLDTLISNDLSRIMVWGNPDDPNTEFGEVCQPGSGWNTIQIGYKDTPNFSGEKVPVNLARSLIGPTWVEEKAKKWGVDSPAYISKVLGLFPEVTQSGLIPVQWVRAAQERWTAAESDPILKSRLSFGRKSLGVDVGGGGDKNVVCFLNGSLATILRKDQVSDTMKTLSNVLEDLSVTGAESANIDAIGIGQGAADRAAEMSKDQRVIEDSPDLARRAGLIVPVKVGASAEDKEKFVNLRAEAAWQLRETFQEGYDQETKSAKPTGIAIDPAEEDLAAQLTNIKYKRSAGRLQVQAKHEMVSSPDEFDALMLANLRIRDKKIRIKATRLKTRR